MPFSVKLEPYATLQAVVASSRLMTELHTSLECCMLTEEAVGTFLHSCEASYVASDLDDPRLGKMAAVRELFQGRYLIFANQKCLYLTY